MDSKKIDTHSRNNKQYTEHEYGVKVCVGRKNSVFTFPSIEHTGVSTDQKASHF